MKSSILIKAGIFGVMSAGFLVGSVSAEMPVYELGEVVVTATRTLKEIQEVPSAVHVIKGEEIQAKNVKTLRQVISQLPGMTMDKRGEGKDGDTITMRGMSTENILILVDGVPMNSTYNSVVDVNDIPVNNVERIEVLRGAASSIYGGHAVAGVINITTKKKDVEGTHFELQGSYGTYNTKHKSFYVNHTKGPLTFGVGWEDKSSDGYRGLYRVAKKKKDAQNFKYTAELPRLSDGSYVYGGRGEKSWSHKGLNLFVNYELNDYESVTYKFTNTKSTYAYNNPFSYVKDKNGNMVFSGLVKTQTGDIISLPTSKFYGYVGGADKQRQSLLYRDNKNNAEILFFHSKDNYNGYSSASLPKKYTKIDWEREGDYSVHPEKVYGFDAQKAWTLNQHTVLVGVNYKKEFMYQDRYDLAKWKDKNSKTNRYAYDSGDMTNTAFYLQDEYKVSDDMTTYLGLRYDRFKKGEGHFVQIGEEGFDKKSPSQTYHELSPKVALDFKSDDGTNYYISYGHSFNPPPMSQVYRYGGGGMGAVIPNPNLDPERSDTWEIGLKKEINKRTTIGVNAYYIDTKDKIAYTYFYRKKDDPAEAPKTDEPQYKQYINFSEEKRKGVELDINSRFTDEISGYFNVSWQKGWISGKGIPKTDREKDFKDKIDYDIPNYIMHAGISYQKNKWTGILDCEYVGKRMSPDKVTEELGAKDSYFLVNVGINYEIMPGGTLQFGIDNLFDKVYYSDEATAGRTYTLGFRYRM